MWKFNGDNNNSAIISDEGIQITYAELFSEGINFSDAIRERCLIFILCTNTIGCLIGYTACLNHKIVPLMIESSIDLQLLQDLIKTYKPKYLWLPEENAFDAIKYNVCYRSRGYILVRMDFSINYDLDDELALLLTTSGSTGSQKLVRQSYENIKSNTKSIIQYLSITSEERPIIVLPLSYTFGLSIVNTHLAMNATILLSSKKIIQSSFWKFFKQYGATSLSGVPYTYEVLKKFNFFNMHLPTLKTLTQAGGKLNEALQVAFANYAKKSNIKFVIMYGQTEATARISYLPYEQCLNKIGSIGIPIPDGKLVLMDEGGEVITSSQSEGELIYCGDNVTLGYATCGEDLNKPDERHKMLFTGDIAYRDDDGYYYIVGRKNRYIKVYGKRVSLDEIEELLRMKFNINELACCGIEDKIYIFSTNTDLNDDMKQYLYQKIGLNKNVFIIKAIDVIPRSDSGKVQYKELACKLVL